LLILFATMVHVAVFLSINQCAHCTDFYVFFSSTGCWLETCLWIHACRHAALTSLPELRNRLRFERPSAFHVIPAGRFGNNWRQLLAAVIAARLFGIRTIHVLSGFLRLREPFFLADGIEICPTNRSARSDRAVFRATFFVTFSRSACSGFTALSISGEIRWAVLSHFPRRPVENSSVYLHMRSGDIWKWLPPVHYGQPPCRFYLSVMQDIANSSRAVAITENRGNPCLDVVLQHGAQWQQRPFEDDMALMLYATKLAVAMSSLSLAILQLSPVRKTIFLCEQPTRPGDNWLLSPDESYHEFGQLRICTVSAEFSKVVLRRWRNSRRQRKMILQESCNWTDRTPV
jgi:hypothetical protein